MNNDFSAAAARIEAIPAAVEAGLNGAMLAAAESCAEAARAVVPVDSGELRSSISASSAGSMAAQVTATAGHAAMVEYGTSRMSPQPYMQPAAEQARAALIEAAAAAVRGAVRGARG